MVFIGRIYQTIKLTNSQRISLPSPLGEGLGGEAGRVGGEAGRVGGEAENLWLRPFFYITLASSLLQPYFLAPLIVVQQTVADVGA